MRYPLKGTQQEDDMASYNVSYNYTVEQADLDALVDIAMLGRANKRGMLIVRVVFAVQTLAHSLAPCRFSFTKEEKVCRFFGLLIGNYYLCQI